MKVTKSLNILYLFYFLASLLYVRVAFNSYGFDDEFFNISLVETYGLSTFITTQVTDVHPPLSYVINALLYATFGDWTTVRIASALAICAAFIYLSENIASRYGRRAATFTFLLLATNPAILMWGTSLRWYAYFLPVLLWLCITPTKQSIAYWVKLTIGLIILGYTGYIAFFIAPAVIWIYWLENQQKFTIKLGYLFISLMCCFVAYWPQLQIFYDFHYPNAGGQTSTLFNSVAGVFIAHFSNQGVFPVSIPATLGSLGMVILMTVALTSQPILALGKDSRFTSYALVTTLMVVSGIAGKFRNLVIASPLQAIWLGKVTPNSRTKKYWVLGFLLITLSNLWGLSNVYFHKNTTKNSWNTPVEDVLNYLSNESIFCDGDAIFFIHDPVISYYVEQNFVNTIGPYMRDLKPLKDNYRCGFIVTTFRGSIETGVYSEMIRSVEDLWFSNKAVVQFREDPHHEFKVRLISDYPQHSVTIIKMEYLKNATLMSSWQ